MLHSCVVFLLGLDYQYPTDVIAKAVPTSFPELRNGSCVDLGYVGLGFVYLFVCSVLFCFFPEQLPKLNL